MFVSRTRFLARKKVCEMCEYYKPSTGSCGTLALGTWVKHEGEDVHLCGCVMQGKLWLSFWKCPIGRWTKAPTAFETLKILNSFSKPPTKDDFRRFQQLKTELKGRALIDSSDECEACLLREMRELRNYVEKYLEEMGEE